MMDANSGEPWSEMDISDLTNELAHGRTMVEIASFLCRDEDEVRQKAKELRLVERVRVDRDVLANVAASRTRWHSNPFLGGMGCIIKPAKIPPAHRH
jgi:hypothetical protein